MQHLPIYLDYQATTPLDPRVSELLLKFYRGESFGNPHSVDHVYGWNAAACVREARAQVAEFVQADDDEILFTSGATESCNLALLGPIAANGKTSERRLEIVTLATEHPAILETVYALQQGGFTCHVAPVTRDGLVDLPSLKEVINERTLVVSVMLVNNEIGVIQPLSAIAELTHRHGALLHTDATQAAGRITIDVATLGVDLLTLSSHKMYGPQGVGCLYVREEIKPRLRAMITGGGQEYGLRSGTLPLPLIAGFGKACEIAAAETLADHQRIKALTRVLWEGLKELFPSMRLHGHPEKRIAGNLNVAFPGYSGEEIIALLRDQMAMATGSACSSSGTEPSHVIVALGFPPDEALQAIRISLGRFTTDREIEQVLELFPRTIGSGMFH